MKDIEILELAFNSLRYRSLRSWLAILGVVIGVASIISLISISTGLNEQIKGQLGGLGANVITITPGGGQAQRATFGSPQGGFGGGGGGSNPITFQEADALRRIAGVDKLDARVSGRATVAYRTKNSSVSVVGVEPYAFPQSATATVWRGRSLRSSDGLAAVVGFGVMNETFAEDLLDKPLKIDGQIFRVVGILNASGASFGGSDNTIFIPQKTAKNLFGQHENASSVVVLAQGGADPDAVAQSVTQALLRLHRVEAERQDFRVVTASSIQSTVSSVTGTLALFLGGIASISLIVGGIGVANAMFTSVLEQTKYIGILKALGTRRVEIMKLFLFEAGLVGLVGGLLGVALSYGASYALAGFGLPTKITPELVGLGMVFSILIGAISGVLPARNAASVQPVEALRYE